MENQFNSTDGIHVISMCVEGGYRKGVQWLLRGLANAIDTQSLRGHLWGARHA